MKRVGVPALRAVAMSALRSAHSSASLRNYGATSANAFLLYYAMFPSRFPDLSAYQNMLSPEFPAFLRPYLDLPLLRRLDGVGLLCGTDWTPLYHNRFFYSRLDHSVGCALIAWHLTRDKTQTLAALLHDVSTPAFSHVSDFRKGDVLKQEATERDNGALVVHNAELARLLRADGIDARAVCDYHIYPICDNEVPRLSADRLEYMFPSGMALNGAWDMPAVARAYADICVLKNERGIDELGFSSVEIAQDYTRRCCEVGLVLQKNENKLALNLLGDILNRAILLGVISEADCYAKSEAELMAVFSACTDADFSRLFRTFTTMTQVLHTDAPLPDSYCVSLTVKKRYINPLVKTADGAVRVTAVSAEAAKIVRNFLDFSDTRYGCVKFC